MSTALHVLIVEDSEDDARLLVRELTRGGYEVTARRVENGAALRAALADSQWEIVVSDYAIPGFGGDEALRIVRESQRDLPFIYVSGTMGEDVAVAAMKSGAHDYVMKGNLARLNAAVEREMRDAVERRLHRAAEDQLRTSEHKYRHLFRSMSDAALLVALGNDRIIDANEQAEILFGQPRDRLLGQAGSALVPALAPAAARETIAQRPDGSSVAVQMSATVVHLNERALLLALFRDITEQRQAEVALHNLQEEFRALSENSPDAISRFDRAARIAYTNPAYCATLGLPAEQLLGRTPTEIYPGHASVAVYEGKVREVLATGRDLQYEVVLEALGIPNPPCYDIRLVPERDQQGEVTSVLSIGREVTARRRAEEALRASEQRFRLFVDQTTEAFFLHAADGAILDANRQACASLGYAREELIGMHPLQFDVGLDARAMERITAQLEAGEAVTFETRHRRKDGMVFPVELHIRSFWQDGGRLSVSLAHDITERRRAEEAVRAREREFRTLAENSPDYIARFDTEARFTYTNPAHRNLTQALSQPTIGKRPLELFPSAPSVRFFQEQVLEVAATGKAVAFELVLDALPDHKPPCHSIRLEPERDDHGRVVSVLAIGRDISALKETERQLRSLAENSPDIILRFDRAGRYLFVNHAMEKATGLPAGEFIGRRVGEIASLRNPPGTAERFRQLGLSLERVFTSGVPLEEEMRLPEPAGERIFNLRLVPETDGSGRVDSVLVLAREVTARQRAEEALRASEQRFRQVTESIDEVFWLTDVARDEVIYISPAYERVWGRPCPSLAANAHLRLDAVHPEDRARVHSAAQSQTAGTYDIQYRIVRPDGTIRWIHDRAFPIKNAAGQVYRVAGVAEDITAKHELEDQLRQAQKMESLGTLAGGIAHDFNNILTGVLGSAEVARLELPADHRATPWLQNIAQAGGRARELIRQIMTFGRKHESQMTPCRLQDVVAEALRLLRSTIPALVQIDSRIDPACPPVIADETQIHQVVMNLCTNAWHALAEQGGRIEVVLGPTEVSEKMAAARLGLKAGSYVLLTVRDNGSGMPPEVRARIFEPFFTTKQQGQGTGLGLAVVHGIVQDHQGAIFVESAPGAGTVFEVYIPVLVSAVPGRADAAEDSYPRGQGEGILLVDDDVSALAGLRAQLEHLGYAVTAVSDPRTALTCFFDDPRRFNLILTDYAMAKGSGHDLARQVLAAWSDFPIILASGLIDSRQIERARSLGVREVVRKPVPTAELARLVARHLLR